jgi:hypothetical protein
MVAETLAGRACLLIAFLLVATSVAAAQTQQRAAPPTWTDEDLQPFFPDAREALVGERPTSPATTTNAAHAESAPDADSKVHWSELVDAETLETEVKRAVARLEAPLANSAAFRSGGHNVCRTEFALLAVLFGVIDQYDGEARWQRDATALRSEFTRASANCKSASDQSYSEAVRRRDQLSDLIRGGRPGGLVPPAFDKWSAVADRALLMQRMELAMQRGVNPRLGGAREFAKAAVDVRHEAQLLAVLAELIRREEYEFWDDDTFQGYSRDLGSAASELSRAAADGDYDAARAAAGRAGQACAACHDGYRA